MPFATRSTFRFSPAVLLFSAPFLFAQAPDAQYNSLFMQGVYASSKKDYAKAEEDLTAALREAERFGNNDLRVASTVNTLGLVYVAEKKFAEAEKAYRRALPIFETVSGDDSLDVAHVNFNIATVLVDRGHEADAIPFVRKALRSYESRLGGASVSTGDALCLEGDADRAMKDYSAAEAPLRRCADIREKNGGMQNPDLADALGSLALVYEAEGKLQLAEPRLRLAEKIRESTLGLTSPVVAQTMEDHAELLRKMGRSQEADKLTTLTSAIRRNQKNQ